MKGIFKLNIVKLTVILLIVNFYSNYAFGVEARPDSFAALVEKSIPAVVNISTKQKTVGKKASSNRFRPDNPYDILKEFLDKEFGVPFEAPERSRRTISLGSGFIVDPKGYIVTNNHVIDQADEIHVVLGGSNDSKSYKAKLIGKDTKTDIALLKIEVKHDLPYLVLGNSSQAKVGDWVIAIGNPFGLGGTVTAGIISAKARYINASQFDDLIQTDAAINMGNSGGPMLNTDGEVIGVNTAIVSPSGGNVGINFAIPSAMVSSVIKQLQDKGEVTRGWLGVMIQVINENIAEGLGLGDVRGALVSRVVKNSPAEKAGIKEGDVITKFDGQEVINSNKLPKMVGEADINKKVKVEIFRDGKLKELHVVLEKPIEEENLEQHDESSEASAKTILGMTFKDITQQHRKAYNLAAEEKGIVITSVESGSIASLMDIKAGDVIMKVNKQTINNSKDFEKCMKEIMDKNKGSAVLLLSRDGNAHYVAVELN